MNALFSATFKFFLAQVQTKYAVGQDDGDGSNRVDIGMVTKPKKALPAAKKGAPSRSFYWLTELVASDLLNTKRYTVQDLLDFAAGGLLVLSFSASSRYVVAGDYEGNDEVFEPPHPDDTYSGLLPLSSDAVWKIISEGYASIEYLFRNEYEFRKLLPNSDQDPFPVVEVSHLMVKADDWRRFTKGLPPEPKYPEKPEDPRIIGTLAYLFAEAKGNPGFFKKDGGLVKEKVVEHICGLISDKNGKPLDGMAHSNVQGKISEALSLMEPKIYKQQGMSDSK